MFKLPDFPASLSTHSVQSYYCELIQQLGKAIFSVQNDNPTLLARYSAPSHSVSNLSFLSSFHFCRINFSQLYTIGLLAFLVDLFHLQLFTLSISPHIDLLHPSKKLCKCWCWPQIHKDWVQYFTSRFYFLRGFINTLCSRRLDALADFQNLYKTDMAIFPTQLVKWLVDSLHQDERQQADRRPELKRLILKVSVTEGYNIIKLSGCLCLFSEHDLLLEITLEDYFISLWAHKAIFGQNPRIYAVILTKFHTNV